MITKLVAAIFIALTFSLVVFKSAAAADGSLYFDAGSITLAKDEQKKVGIFVDPKGEELVGIDLIIKYDPASIQVVDVENTGIFSSIPQKIIDNVNGVVKVAFSNNYQTYTKNISLFANILVKGLDDTKNSTISFDYTFGKTTDTNVVNSQGIDVLSSVNSLDIKGSNNSDGNQITSTPAPTLTPTSTPTPTPTKKDKNSKDKPEKPNPPIGKIPDIWKNVLDFIQKFIGGRENVNVLGEQTNATSNVTSPSSFRYILIGAIIFISGISFGIAVNKLVAIRRRKL